MLVKFRPRKEIIEKIPSKALNNQGKVFNFEFAFEMDGEKFYESDDLKCFPSILCSEKDIEKVENSDT